MSVSKGVGESLSGSPPGSGFLTSETPRRGIRVGGGSSPPVSVCSSTDFWTRPGILTIRPRISWDLK